MPIYYRSSVMGSKINVKDGYRVTKPYDSGIIAIIIVVSELSMIQW